MCAAALLAFGSGCGGTAVDTSSALTPGPAHRHVDPALVRARASAAEAETALAWARTSIATRWLLEPERQDAFTAFTGEVALDAVCKRLLEAMPGVDRARLHRLEKHGALARATVDHVQRGTTASLVKAGRRWAARRFADGAHGGGVEWWAWAHDVHHAVRGVIRGLAHDGAHQPAPLHSLVHGPSWVATRAFAEYTRLCTRPAR